MIRNVLASCMVHTRLGLELGASCTAHKRKELELGLGANCMGHTRSGLELGLGARCMGHTRLVKIHLHGTPYHLNMTVVRWRVSAYGVPPCVYESLCSSKLGPSKTLAPALAVAPALALAPALPLPLPLPLALANHSRSVGDLLQLVHLVF